jgi:lipopolysaccharide/colanic/teichoic acid biosynthesis glycosyltransferase
MFDRTVDTRATGEAFEGAEIARLPDDIVLKPGLAAPSHDWSVAFCCAKRAFDIVVGLVGVIAMAVLAIFLVLVLNPLFNRGPVFFRQWRMGRNGVPFQIWKFRTMTMAPSRKRGADDGVEEDRITRLGRIMRKFRIDELPNFINVLAGDMSVIGPRPDMIEHAEVLKQEIPRYRNRFAVRPGITGLAQVRHGYADGIRATVRKARLDELYINRVCLMLEAYIVVQTVMVVLTGFRAR